MKHFEINEIKDSSTINIVVVGVGGGGCNMINHLAESIDIKNLDLIAVNTDVQALESIKNKKIKKIQIGEKKTKGLG